MSYLTSQTLQYGVTHAQESAESLPHVPWRNLANLAPQDYGISVSWGFPGGIDTRVAKHKIVTRAALKRRHVSFSGPNDALRKARSGRPNIRVTRRDRHDQQR